jgi:hypothetical protein
VQEAAQERTAAKAADAADARGVDGAKAPGPEGEQGQGMARNWGVGKGIDLYNLIMNGSQRMLWTFSDALMASQVRELEMGGMTRADAIAHARIHMPDYRLPIQAFGSGAFGRGMVGAMSDRNLAIFGRYHMGVFSSLYHMMTLGGLTAMSAGQNSGKRWETWRLFRSWA